MDFAEFAKQYLDRKTGDDPASMMSEESLMFVDMLRAEDTTKRAESVQSSTGRSEVDDDDSFTGIGRFTEDGQEVSPNTAASNEGQSAESTPVESAAGQTAEPANAVNEPSPDAEILNGESEQGSPEFPNVFTESDDQSPAPEVTDSSSVSGEHASEVESVSENGVVAQPAVSEESPVARDAEPLQAVFEEPQDVTPNVSQSESGAEAQSAEEFSSSGESSDEEIPEPFLDAGESQDAEPAEAISQATNEDLAEEGVRVHDSGNGTTILEPPGMPDISEMLLRVDRDFGTPTVSAGDQEIPEGTEEPERDELISSTDRAENMMSLMADDIMKWDRHT